MFWLKQTNKTLKCVCDTTDDTWTSVQFALYDACDEFWGSLVIQHLWNDFRVEGRARGKMIFFFFKVIPCRFEWSYSHFAWDIWHVWVVISIFRSAVQFITRHFLPPCSQPLWELKNSLRSLDDWWGERWRLAAQVHALGCLASGHKALSGLGWRGRREALQLDSTADRFSDNAHTTIRPRSVDTKTLL